MNDLAPEAHTAPHSRHKKPFVGFLLVGYLFELLVTSMQKNLGVISREADLFVGSLFLTVGLLGFNSSKFCDGNTADYLSCTRPSTFYYYSAFDMVLVVLGVSFVLFWFFKREGKKNK